jgi:NitT/TauT family transport system permease protein
VAQAPSGQAVAAAPASAAASSPSGQREGWGPLLFVVICLIALMQVASLFLPPFVMPAPLVILQAGYDILTTQYEHIGITALRLAVALLFAISLGVLLGIVMGIFPSIRPYLRSLIIIDTGIPALSWMLLAIFWFSQPELRIFFILSVILIPFYALNIYDAIRALPREWIDMIESFRPTRLHVLRYLITPHIVPFILTTTKSVLGYAVRMAIFAELVASAVGIGSRMSLAQSMFRIDYVLGWTVILVIANLLLQGGLNAIEKLLLKWRPEASVR